MQSQRNNKNWKSPFGREKRRGGREGKAARRGRCTCARCCLDLPPASDADNSSKRCSREGRILLGGKEKGEKGKRENSTMSRYDGTEAHDVIIQTIADTHLEVTTENLGRLIPKIRGKEGGGGKEKEKSSKE